MFVNHKHWFVPHFTRSRKVVGISNEICYVKWAESPRDEQRHRTVPAVFLSEVFVCIWSLEKDRSHSSSWYWRSIHRKFAICSSFGTANSLNQVFAIIWKWVKLWNSDNIIRYLDDQKELVAHILWFRSTHEYYETAKYEGHPTTGDRDRPCSIYSC